MKLTDIDLNDKSEVAAAHALLAAVLGVSELTITNRVGEISQSATGSVQQLVQAGVIEPNPAVVFAQPLPSMPADAAPLQDPAAVFGGQSATPLPGLPALSSAGAAQLPTAPAGLPGSLPAATASPPPAAFIAPEVHAAAHAAAAAGAAGQSSPVGGVELDTRGLPWDGRIHAGTKSKKKDGSWTALRGLNDDAKVKQIEAELRATTQGAQLGALVQAQGAAPLTGLPASNAGSLPPATSTSTVAATTGRPVAGASASADPTTFEQLMPRVTQATIAGLLPPTALQQVCAALGLQSVVALQTNPAFVPQAWAHLKASYPAVQ